MNTWRSLGLAILGPGVLSAGCALTSKAEPLRPRYFDPEMARLAPRDPVAAAGPGFSLRLGRIDSSSYLREPIAFRSSGQELGSYQSRRWTEKPQEYLRRELARAFFEEHGFVRSLAGDGPTLEAELLEFTEVRSEHEHKARMRVAVLLHDQRAGLLEQTITVERLIAGAPDADDASAVVRAFSEALHDGVEQIAERVARTLRANVPNAAAASNVP